jgi:thiopeptide-type bacteriocin biosynthesis protein
MTDRHAASWLYLQVFIQETLETPFERDALIGLGDELITPYVRQWVGHCRAQGWASRFFFLRYGSGGYHLRLRMLGRPDVLEESVEPYLARGVADFFNAHLPALGLPDAPLSAEDLRRMGRLRRDVYEPEYSKYGGAEGMPLAEEHFEVSSEVTIDVLEAERASGIRRAQFVLELIRVLVGAFTDSPLEQAFIYKTYTHYWVPLERLRRNPSMAQTLESNYARQREDLVRRFDAGGAGSLELKWREKSHDPFPRWRAHVTEHVARLKAMESEGRLRAAQFDGGEEQRRLLSEVPGIAGAPVVSLLMITNYLHMLCNRLALPPLYEVQLTYLLYRHLEEKFGVSADPYPVLLEPEA